MATVNLEYTGTISNTFATTIDNVAADDGVYCVALAPTQKGIITLDDAPAAATSINSVRVVLVDTWINRRGFEATWTVKILDSSSTYYTETQLIGSKTDDYSLTTRTTSDGSTPWSLSIINDLRVELECSIMSPGPRDTYIDYVYVILDYNTGYGNDVNGVGFASISKVNGVATADISKVNGV